MLESQGKISENSVRGEGGGQTRIQRNLRNSRIPGIPRDPKILRISRIPRISCLSNILRFLRFLRSRRFGVMDSWAAGYVGYASVYIDCAARTLSCAVPNRIGALVESLPTNPGVRSETPNASSIFCDPPRL